MANQSDSFLCVVTHLIKLGDKQEEETGSSNSQRQKSLLMLAKMNPCLRLSMRALCVDLCRMPGTAVLLSLQEPEDLVCWLSGLLLGTDQTVKNWISFWNYNWGKYHYFNDKTHYRKVVKFPLKGKKFYSTSNT